ncbi:hypothetical protein [Streptomyces sp. V1I6]|uniref:hypothetical protein n=1 Tax=Streptomyces sp. V1I6 TaxID=3042273 RepID=UPI002787257A|nr:hypothetical protein [Streptomyces sp. V1I6]MDQ0847062.1 hypothetical protein [Streptomyces sp. V1I6]
MLDDATARFVEAVTRLSSEALAGASDHALRPWEAGGREASVRCRTRRTGLQT